MFLNGIILSSLIFATFNFFVVILNFCVFLKWLSREYFLSDLMNILEQWDLNKQKVNKPNIQQNKNKTKWTEMKYSQRLKTEHIRISDRS